MRGVFDCFQGLAFQTTVTLFVSRGELLKYNGLMSVLRGIPLLLGPVLGGVLIGLISMENIILLDVFTFLVGFKAKHYGSLF